MENTTQREMSEEEVEMHDLRKEVDALMQKIGRKSMMYSLAEPKGRTLEKVRTHLEEAKMWLGKTLEAMNTPYPDHLADKAPMGGATAPGPTQGQSFGEPPQ